MLIILFFLYIFAVQILNHLVMKRYYLIKVNAPFCPTFYVSSKNFHRILDVCHLKGFLVTVYSSLLLHSNPDVGLNHFKEVYNILTNID